MKDYYDVPDSKNPRVFKRVKAGPEVSKHHGKWDKAKCKKNKGNPHNVGKTVVKKDWMIYKTETHDNEIICYKRRSYWFDETWKCEDCGKDYTFELGPTFKQRQEMGRDNAYGEWEEYSRRTVKSVPVKQQKFRQRLGYRKMK